MIMRHNSPREMFSISFSGSSYPCLNAYAYAYTYVYAFHFFFAE